MRIRRTRCLRRWGFSSYDFCGELAVVAARRRCAMLRIDAPIGSVISKVLGALVSGLLKFYRFQAPALRAWLI